MDELLKSLRRTTDALVIGSGVLLLFVLTSRPAAQLTEARSAVRSLLATDFSDYERFVDEKVHQRLTELSWDPSSLQRALEEACPHVLVDINASTQAARPPYVGRFDVRTSRLADLESLTPRDLQAVVQTEQARADAEVYTARPEDMASGIESIREDLCGESGVKTVASLTITPEAADQPKGWQLTDPAPTASLWIEVGSAGPPWPQFLAVIGLQRHRIDHSSLRDWLRDPGESSAALGDAPGGSLLDRIERDWGDYAYVSLGKLESQLSKDIESATTGRTLSLLGINVPGALALTTGALVWAFLVWQLAAQLETLRRGATGGEATFPWMGFYRGATWIWVTAALVTVPFVAALVVATVRFATGSGELNIWIPWSVTVVGGPGLYLVVQRLRMVRRVIGLG